jgi:MFS family permease
MMVPMQNAAPVPGGAGSKQFDFAATFTSLRERDFRFLWMGALCIYAAMQMAGVARGYLAYDITSSPLLLGVVNVGFSVPMLFLALFGGAVADRFRRKRVIQVTQGIVALSSLFIAVSVSTGIVTWIHLLIASFINGIVFAFMVPSRTAMIPDLVGKDLVTNALALNSMALSVMTFLGPALAGNLYSILGPAGVYYVIAGIAGSAVLFTGAIRTQETHFGTDRRGMLRDIGEGFGYIRQRPVIISLLVLGLSLAIFGLPILQLLPVFVVEIYERGPEALGLLMSCAGLGALAGSFGIASMGRRRRGLILLGGGIMSGIALLIIASVPLYAVAAAALVFLGLGNGIRRALNLALIMELSDEAYRGRVSSIYVMNFGLMPLGVLPAGAVAEYFGPQISAAYLGIVLSTIVVVIIIAQKRIRTLD